MKRRRGGDDVSRRGRSLPISATGDGEGARETRLNGYFPKRPRRQQGGNGRYADGGTGTGELGSRPIRLDGSSSWGGRNRRRRSRRALTGGNEPISRSADQRRAASQPAQSEALTAAFRGACARVPSSQRDDQPTGCYSPPQPVVAYPTSITKPIFKSVIVVAIGRRRTRPTSARNTRRQVEEHRESEAAEQAAVRAGRYQNRQKEAGSADERHLTAVQKRNCAADKRQQTRHRCPKRPTTRISPTGRATVVVAAAAAAAVQRKQARRPSRK
uniref:Uncharacterized protein n=1 Tax=Plectus sambesii TaxID=2011161 RepID=A0A914V653_9BILA